MQYKNLIINSLKNGTIPDNYLEKERENEKNTAGRLLKKMKN